MKKQPTLLILAALLCVSTSSLFAQNGQMRESIFEPGQRKPIYSLGGYFVMSGKENHPIGLNGEFKVMKVTSFLNPEAQQLSNSFITTTIGLYSVPEADSKFGFFDKHKTPTINIAYLMAGYRYYFGSFDYDQSDPWQWFLEGNLGLGMITYKNPAVAFSAGAGFSLSKRLDGHIFYSGFYHNDKPLNNIGSLSFGMAYKFR
ncbi:hypothetical protein LZZ85_27450 [Terrimonas sp. NA20]|uniref:Outer membrane protein beta-barrel domain-containing protein n=1 Tax=Terrimonas ginsenosidimutans TaxID=2908004 RepID=A0ABS9L0D8_9BACT|nr:hypothetical protein [Terrimonas ginsenosidimutans]MCG2618070.1 hypothetical protein [Terrimonas ginsenosidimutans]